jgi:CBS domain-containing protein
MVIKELLNKIARPAHTISVDQTVEDAINLMTAMKVSALIVTEHDRPMGIFTDRDILRTYLRDRTAELSDISLKSALTSRLLTADPNEDIRSIIGMMVKDDIRHLPVTEDKKIIGMIAFNDLIALQLKILNTELGHLKDYINDLHEARQD